MPSIHPTAILEGDINLAEEVEIGPHCVLTGPLTLGSGVRLLGHNYITGPLTMGRHNTVYPFACLGFSPQDLSFDHDNPGAGITMGDHNVIREQVTIHRATDEEKPTRLGSCNYLMVGSHIGHDCIVGDHCIFANNVSLAGHVRGADRVIIGGGTLIHQFCRLGRGSFLSGGVFTTKDIPPWFMLTGINCAGSINLVGMRRNGLSTEEITAVKWVYKIIYRRGLTPGQIRKSLAEKADTPIVQEYIEFMDQSTRGIVAGTPDNRR